MPDEITDFDAEREARAKKLAKLTAEVAELTAPLPDDQFLGAVGAYGGMPRSQFPLIPDQANVEIIEGVYAGQQGTYVAHNTEWGMAVIALEAEQVHVPYTWVICHDVIDDPEVEIALAPSTTP